MREKGKVGPTYVVTCPRLARVERGSHLARVRLISSVAYAFRILSSFLFFFSLILLKHPPIFFQYIIYFFCKSNNLSVVSLF